jgi:vacuolar-type H+-ATPase subunit C/Vma6
MTNIEYVVIRLRAIRSGYIHEDRLEGVVDGKDSAAILSLLADSNFNVGVERFKQHQSVKPRTSSLIRIIDESRNVIIEKIAAIVAFSLPEEMELVFSRFELEQLKDVMRCIRGGETFIDKRLVFQNLHMPHKGWTSAWRSFQNIDELMDALKNQHHHFYPALAKRGGDQFGSELELEKFYFNIYLPSRIKGSIDYAEYFSWKHSMLNIHTAYLLNQKRKNYPGLAEFYIDGPGKVTRAGFERLVDVQANDFPAEVSRILGIRLMEEAIPDTLPNIINAAFLRWMKSKVFHEPFSIFEILFHLEQLSALVSNLKLAVYFSGIGAPFKEVKDNFILAEAI